MLGDPGSIVHGFLHNQIFEGKIYTSRGKQFHIEPAWKYLNDSKYHSVIYDVANIHYPYPYGAGCGIKNELKDWMRKVQTSRDADETKDDSLKKEEEKDPESVRVRRAASDKTSCRLFVQVRAEILIIF